MRSAPLILAAALACSGSEPAKYSPPEPTVPAAPPPNRTEPRSFADLDASGRREVCETIVDRVRVGCDPDLRDLDATLIDQCVGDHPIWACTQVTVSDHARCLGGRDAAACTAHQRQTEQCGVRAALQQCKLSVADVDPAGPAAAAGLRAGDVLISLDGAPKSVEDLEGILAIVKRSAGRALQFKVTQIGHPARELAIAGAGAPLRIGATFAPSPNCSGWSPRFAAVPCNARTDPGK